MESQATMPIVHHPLCKSCAVASRDCNMPILDFPFFDVCVIVFILVSQLFYSALPNYFAKIRFLKVTLDYFISVHILGDSPLIFIETSSMSYLQIPVKARSLSSCVLCVLCKGWRLTLFPTVCPTPIPPVLASLVTKHQTFQTNVGACAADCLVK